MAQSWIAGSSSVAALMRETQELELRWESVV